jgi:DNA-binding NtrC family response regulator
MREALASKVRNEMTTAPKRVLIVDDETHILFVLRHALARLGCECQVETFAKSVDALEAARHTPFDLVITDIRMPDMDGVAFTEALRALYYDPIVIWMTAYDCCATGPEAERLRVHRCLDKPLEVAEIRRIVSETLWGTSGASG